MPARNDEKLADFELSWVDERERSVGRIDDVPNGHGTRVGNWNGAMLRLIIRNLMRIWSQEK